jgi:predicted Fe-Mo cluster-binding NifX family protein
MRLAVATWHGRISPVLDESRRVLLVELKGGAEIGRQELQLAGPTARQRAEQLAALKPDLLLCGMVSRELAAALRARAVGLRSLVRGEVEEVLAAYQRRGLDQDRFRMPGRCRPGAGEAQGGGG